MKEAYTEILKTRSLTVIGYKAEDALKIADNPIDKQALLKIMETNNLDLAWAIAHEQLGQMEQATELRQWADAKAKRQPGLTGILNDLMNGLDSHKPTR